MGRRSEQVLHLKLAAAIGYLPSWPLDMTALCLSSTLTTISTFSLEGEKRGAEREQQWGCARQQLVTVTARRKGLLQHRGDHKGPGCVILASDTQLSPLPSRTWVRRDTLTSRFAGAVPSAKPWLWSWYSQCRAGSQQDSFVNTWDCFLPLTGFSSLLCNLLQYSPLQFQLTLRETPKLCWRCSPGTGGVQVCTSMCAKPSGFLSDGLLAGGTVGQGPGV